MNAINKDFQKSSLGGQLKAELTRKSIHLSIALVPVLAACDRSNTALLLFGGIFFYVCAESLRFLGFSLPLVSSVTAAVSRNREQGRFVLAPVTLGLGALLALLLFPPPVAAAAIYALAFGDSASAIVGRSLGRIRLAFLCGKSLEGILSCFIASALSGYLVFQDMKMAFVVGFTSLVVDALPLRDYDNLLFPLAVGFAALVFQSL